MRAKSLILVLALFGVLAPAAPGQAVGCKPVCAVSGVLSGSDLHLPFTPGAFSWNLSFDGGVTEQGTAPRRVTSAARLYGMIESVQGARVSGVGTIAVFDASEGQRLAAVPVQIDGFPGGAGGTRAVLEPYGVGVGHGSALTLIEGSLRGAFNGMRLTDDEVSGVDVSISAPSTFVVGQAFTIDGAVTRDDGAPLPSVPVDVEVDGRYLKRVQTRNDGTWSTQVQFTSAEPLDLRAVAFAQSPLPAASPTVRTWPTYLLTLTPSGPGSVSALGTTCSSTCTIAIAPGSSVTVSHQAQRFYRFSSWSGSCSGSGACVVQMNAAKTVTASFLKLNWDVVESEPNGTSATADPMGVPGIYAGNLTAGDVDIVQISVPVATTLYAETFDRFLACSEPIDTTVTIRSSNGTQLAFDDDGGLGLCSAASIPLLPGIVRIEVRPYGPTVAEEYRLKLRLSDPTEPNDTFATATPAVAPVDVIGAISPFGDLDFYRFTVGDYFSNTTLAVFDSSGSTCADGIDPVLTMYDANGVTSGGWFDDDSGPGRCPSLTVSLSPGEYRVRVSDYQDNSVIPAYRLMISTSNYYP